MEKTRRQIAREKATIGVYQNLLVESSLEDILTFLNEEKTLTKSEETMAFSRWLVETTLQNKESYQTLIEKHLKKGWKFERLSMMEKAILMIAACELLESDLPKTIVTILFEYTVKLDILLYKKGFVLGYDQIIWPNNI